MERSHAERVLELPRLLERVAARCETEFGADLILELSPSFDPVLIRSRIAKTSEALALVMAAQIPVYGNARDVRISIRDAAKGAMLSGETIFRTSETLGALSRVRRWLQSAKDDAPSMWQVGEGLPFLTELQGRIESSVSPEGEVLDSASPELRALRAKKVAQNKKIVDRIQSMVSSMKAYLQEPLFTQRSGRYVLPVKSGFKGKVPGIVHDSSGSGQTIFIEPQAIVDETNKLREIEGAEREEQEKVLLALSAEIGKHAIEIAEGINTLAEIDASLASAKDAEKSDGYAPKLVSYPLIKIERGHHPLLDREISVALDVGVGGSMASLLITGPNTGGKTVCLKLLGIYSLMIGCGLFPPARSVEYGSITGIWADIGDEQSLQQSLSTFSGHLKNVARALKEAGAGSLCLFDEIGAGTDPAEGAAIAKSVLETLAQRGAVIAASTHYGELKEYAIGSDYFRTAAMEFDLATLRPTYKLIPGATGASHAFEIARRHGLPQSVAERAESLLSDSEKRDRKKSEQLDDLISAAEAARAEIEESRRLANAERAKLQEERERVKEKLVDARESAREIVADAIREMREKYRELLEVTAGLPGAKREELLEQARRLESEFIENTDDIAPTREPQEVPYEPGDTVQVRGRAQAATVLEVQRNGSVAIQMGALRFTVKPDDIVPVEKPNRKPKPVPRNAPTTHVATEIMLRRMRVEEAQAVLDEYFDNAILSGLHKARIVHGKGDGILRKVVREFLAGRSEVAKYYEASPDSGGAGVTIVEFKS